VEKRKKRLIIIAIICVLAGTLLIVFGAVCRTDGFWGPLLSGAGASVIASFLFWALTDLLTSNPEIERLSHIAERFEYMEQTKADGLVEIRKRKDADEKFWVEFAEGATSKLTLSGRTLNRWLDDGKQQSALKDAINRIVQLKIHSNLFDEPVRLVMYSDEGIKNEAGKASPIKNNKLFEEGLKKEKERFKDFIYKIWDAFDNEQKDRIAVYEVNVLPYMYCNNGQICVTGTYFDNKADKMNMQMVLKCGSGIYERDYSEDFISMLRRTADPSDISAWRK